MNIKLFDQEGCTTTTTNNNNDDDNNNNNNTNRCDEMTYVFDIIYV